MKWLGGCQRFTAILSAKTGLNNFDKKLQEHIENKGPFKQYVTA